VKQISRIRQHTRLRFAQLLGEIKILTHDVQYLSDPIVRAFMALPYTIITRTRSTPVPNDILYVTALITVSRVQSPYEYHSPTIKGHDGDN